MSMSDHIKQRVLQLEFLPIRCPSTGKRQTGFFCFTRVGEPAHMSKVFYLFGVEVAWHTVLICCTMCGTEQPKEQPQIGDRGSNPVVINQFLIFFSLMGQHVLVLFFSFANILYFTWLTSHDLILL